MRPTISTNDTKARRSIRAQTWTARLLTLVNLSIWAGLIAAWHFELGEWIAILICSLLVIGVVLRAMSRWITIDSFKTLWPVQIGGALAMFVGIAAFHRPPGTWNVTLLTMMISVMVTWFSALVWWDSPRIIAKGICRNCGYNLHGLTGWTCPECGKQFEPDDVDR
jgi:hypothetical protein